MGKGKFVPDRELAEILHKIGTFTVKEASELLGVNGYILSESATSQRLRGFVDIGLMSRKLIFKQYFYTCSGENYQDIIAKADEKDLRKASKVRKKRRVSGIPKNKKTWGVDKMIGAPGTSEFFYLGDD